MEIDKAQFSVLQEMRRKGNVNWTEDKALHDYVISEGYPSIEDFVKRFCETRLVCSEDGF